MLIGHSAIFFMYYSKSNNMHIEAQLCAYHRSTNISYLLVKKSNTMDCTYPLSNCVKEISCKMVKKLGRSKLR